MTTASMGAGDELAVVIEDVRRGVQRITEGVHDIGTAIDRVIDTLPEAVATWAHEQFEKALGLVRDALAKTDAFLAQRGDPAALRAAATNWARQVGGPVSGLAAVTTLNTMEADDHWQGIAATAYKSTLPAQTAAFTAVKTATDKVGDILHGIATAITTFWVSVAAALATLLGALLVATGVAATGAGVPVALGLTGAELAAFIAALVAAGTGLGVVIAASTSAVGALTDVATTDTAFPSGSWPVSTTPLDDASLTDGDDTDWKILT
jgi:hypothetical protein